MTTTAASTARSTPPPPVSVPPGGDPRFGTGPYADWCRAFLARIQSSPVRPRLRWVEETVDDLVAQFLARVGKAGGPLPQPQARAVVELVGIHRSLTATFLEARVFDGETTGSYDAALRDLGAVAGAMERAGLLRDVPPLRAVLNGMGIAVAAASVVGREARNRELAVALAGLAWAMSNRSASAVAGDGLPGAPREARSDAAGPGAGLAETLAEIDALVGLGPVKRQVASLVNQAEIMAARRAAGLAVPSVSRHLVFTGNPGTGKTTVARLISRVYGRLGLLAKGHLVEVDRSMLVAGYLGQTAIKTREKIAEAMGGILFVDEAYALVNGDQDAFGQEAIDTLVKAMEDHREELVVVVAGYQRPMQAFLDANVGLRSRLPTTVDFPDYEARDLLAILAKFAREGQYDFAPPAREEAAALLQRLHAGRGEGFGNGRLARNLFEAIVAAQADRLVGMAGRTAADLVAVVRADVAEAGRLVESGAVAAA